MKLVLAVVLAFGLLAGSASAAKPTRFVVDLDDPALEADLAGLLSGACGAEITEIVDVGPDIYSFDPATGHLTSRSPGAR